MMESKTRVNKAQIVEDLVRIAQVNIILNKQIKFIKY